MVDPDPSIRVMTRIGADGVDRASTTRPRPAGTSLTLLARPCRPHPRRASRQRARRRRHPHVGASSIDAGERRSRPRCSAAAAPSRTRSRSTSTTARSTSSRSSPRSRPASPSVNTNYRYAADELVYLWDNADVVAVVFHGTFADQCEAVRARGSQASPRGCGSTTAAGPCPDWAIAVRRRRRPHRPGGTCDGAVGSIGRPPAAALHRRHHRACPRASCGDRTTCSAPAATRRQADCRPARTSTAFAGTITKPGPRNLPGGTAHARHRLVQRASQPADRRLDRHHRAAASFDADRVARHVAAPTASKSMTIVGDAFAKPHRAALDAEPARWDLSAPARHRVSRA